MVDDDITTTYLNERLIKKLGIANQIMVARNGKEGLELVERFYKEQGILPELILLDINMPVMDGFEFLIEYRKLNIEDKESAQIVMLTTSSNPLDINKVRNLGVSGYLNKPLKAEGLNQILGNN